MPRSRSQIGIAALAGVIGGILLGGVAAAQPPLDDSRLEPVVARIRGSLREARAARLPSVWLLDRAAEGLAKGVPPARIAQAIEHLLEQMRAADALLLETGVRMRRSSRERALRAVVDARAVGAPPEPLAALLLEAARADRARAPELIRRAATLVAELGEHGFSGDVAVEVTRVALREGGPSRWGLLLEAARGMGRGDPLARVRALRGAARGGSTWRRHRPHRPTDRAQGPHGPPHDDAFGLGRGRGRGRD
ncbi:MAG: hypothetical protein OEY14_04345 [Myxococcales bacterium]|nr:hypothetical protein [Myxococcales bacterium]